MKRVFVLLLAIAATSAFSVGTGGFQVPKFPDMELIVPDDRIIGGSAIPIEQAPYQVGLFIDNGYWCGGALVKETAILTAAHCVSGYKAYQVTIYLGSTSIASSNSTVRVAKSLYVHEDWNENTAANDIALLKFDSVTLNSNIKLIQLPTATFVVEDGTSAIATGWGRTSDSNPSLSISLQSVVVNVISNQLCGDTYSIIIPSNICVATTGGNSTCNGDSGGPLVTDSNPKILIGLTSFGAAAGCELGYPAVFTRVSSYIPWINANL